MSTKAIEIKMTDNRIEFKTVTTVDELAPFKTCKIMAPTEKTLEYIMNYVKYSFADWFWE